ncbi:hypothetical protein CAL7716_062890 [Calothrix sp. PCC 7716]|nr:hypothetical protein CAL7716_062890 [Calothrix sp. PCC 7716]
MKAKKFTITFALTTCFTAVAGTKAVQAASLTVIADGISNARGAAFGPDGNLYVGEPGIGGNGNCQPSPSTLFQPICAGNTGSVVKITPDGKQERIFNNFQSLAEQPSGNQGAGPQELQFDSLGNAYLLTGFAGYPGNRDLELNTLGTQYPIPEAQLNTFPPSPPDQLLNTPNLGKLFKADLKTEQLTEIFDFGKYEIINNPDGADVVSNPYELTIGGNTAYVVDGGGNAAYKIKLDGSDMAAIPLPKKLIDNPDFPPLPPGAEIPPGLVEIPADALPDGQPADGAGQIPAQILVQSVPTGAAIGLDGALYVGEYLGFPYPEGQARIFRIGEDNQPQVFAEGFTHITDLTFDKNGNLLVLQFSDQAQWKGDLQNLPGSLIQLAPDGTRTTLVAAGQGLASADGITIGPDNQIYVTTRGVGPNLGQIVRVERTRIPEPSSMVGLLVVGAIGGSAMLKRKHRVSC